MDLRDEGDSRVEKLKVRGQELLRGHGEKEGRDLQDVICILRDVECHWVAVLQSADEQHRYCKHEHKCKSHVHTVFKYMVIFTQIQQHTTGFHSHNYYDIILYYIIFAYTV